MWSDLLNRSVFLSPNAQIHYLYRFNHVQIAFKISPEDLGKFQFVFHNAFRFVEFAFSSAHSFYPLIKAEVKELNFQSMLTFIPIIAFMFCEWPIETQSAVALMN